ncbi:MAG: DMT family transporter, partial [Candidatus Omnitrophota bacterium]
MLTYFSFPLAIAVSFFFAYLFSPAINDLEEESSNRSRFNPFKQELVVFNRVSLRDKWLTIGNVLFVGVIRSFSLFYAQKFLGATTVPVLGNVTILFSLFLSWIFLRETNPLKDFYKMSSMFIVISYSILLCSYQECPRIGCALEFFINICRGLLDIGMIKGLVAVCIFTFSQAAGGIFSKMVMQGKNKSALSGDTPNKGHLSLMMVRMQNLSSVIAAASVTLAIHSLGKGPVVFHKNVSAALLVAVLSGFVTVKFFHMYYKLQSTELQQSVLECIRRSFAAFTFLWVGVLKGIFGPGAILGDGTVASDWPLWVIASVVISGAAVPQLKYFRGRSGLAKESAFPMVSSSVVNKVSPLANCVSILKGLRHASCLSCEDVLSCLRKIRSKRGSKFTVDDFAAAVDELEWWENHPSERISLHSQDAIRFLCGSTEVGDPNKVVMMTRRDRYGTVKDRWLMEVLKRQDKLRSFVEVGVSINPYEHLGLVRDLKEIRPEARCLGLDILPVKKIRFEVQLDSYEHFDIVYCDENLYPLFAVNRELAYVEISPDKKSDIHKKVIHCLEKNKPEKYRRGLLSYRDFYITVREVDYYRQLGQIQGSFVCQGTFQTLKRLKEIDVIFTANTLRHDWDFALTSGACEAARTALSEGGVLIEANSSRQGRRYMASLLRKEGGVLVPQEVVIDIARIFTGEADIFAMQREISSIVMSKFLPATIRTACEQTHSIVSVLIEFPTYIRKHEDKIYQYISYGSLLSAEGVKYLLTRLTNKIKQKGLRAELGQDGIIHIYLKDTASPVASRDAGSSAVSKYKGTYTQAFALILRQFLDEIRANLKNQFILRR